MLPPPHPNLKKCTISYPKRKVHSTPNRSERGSWEESAGGSEVDAPHRSRVCKLLRLELPHLFSLVQRNLARLTFPVSAPRPCGSRSRALRHDVARVAAARLRRVGRHGRRSALHQRRRHTGHAAQLRAPAGPGRAKTEPAKRGAGRVRARRGGGIRMERQPCAPPPAGEQRGRRCKGRQRQVYVGCARDAPVPAHPPRWEKALVSLLQV